MLVDLARNDLSRHARNVTVESLREIQFYSHVIHLVSSVSGELREESSAADMLTATSPQETLTGAPKHKAMQLIDKYENQRRGYYGGAIGFIDLKGTVNHAIMIRTFLSKGNKLFYQAGAGIVAGSNENNELQEVNNKLGALKKAIQISRRYKMKKTIVIDNYDSFTYNLVHCIENLTGQYPEVRRNDEISLDEINDYDKILISPGPGIPSESGVCLELIKNMPEIKVFWVSVWVIRLYVKLSEGKILNLSSVYHCVSSPVKIKTSDELLFENIPPVIMAGRYHSWVVSKKHLPACFIVTCEDDNGIIMGITHKDYDVRGLQFHPESVLTEYGSQIIKNWLEL
jgi:anthranilate synthase/aminodeoxychorismate synthase-like glutamine amidotransferase